MKTKLQHVGFFRELPYGDPNGLSISSLLSEINLDEKQKIVSYLKSGVACVVSPGLSRDVLSENRNIIGSLSLLTDGIFLWPADLAHYVEKYSVGIPQEFQENMKGNAWVVPANIDIQSLAV